jgi:hypothetical protein
MLYRIVADRATATAHAALPNAGVTLCGLTCRSWPGLEIPCARGCRRCRAVIAAEGT